MFDPRWGDDPRGRGDDRRDRSKEDRNDGDFNVGVGRGPNSQTRKAEQDPRDRDDERRPARERDSGGRDPRDVFMRDVNLSRGREWETVYDARGREYPHRRQDSRAAMRVRSVGH